MEKLTGAAPVVVSGILLLPVADARNAGRYGRLPNAFNMQAVARHGAFTWTGTKDWIILYKN